MPALATFALGDIECHRAQSASQLLSEIAIASPDRRYDGAKNLDGFDRQVDNDEGCITAW
jgi:hypothetical protein